MMKVKILAVILFLALLGYLAPQAGYCQEDVVSLRKLFFFYSPTCKKCQEFKVHLLPQLVQDFQGRIKVEQRDITRMEDYALLLRLEEKYRPKLGNSVPLFFFEGHFLEDNDLYRQLERLLVLPPQDGAEEGVSPASIAYRLRSFNLMTIVSAGLIDGINPCAFTVIIFFISFLALQGYRKRELLVIGLTFILAVFLTYILIGIGLFGFLYRLKSFWVVSKVINIAVGVFSIALGFLALYDFLKFQRTRESEGMVLQLPQYLKRRIHFIIGSHYRNTPGNPALKRNIFSLVLSALITGFLVSLIEAVCTGQVYLPTIVFMLKTTPLKFRALGYLLLYNLFFILPLGVIFVLALFGVTSEQFSGILKKRLGLIKALMAALFFVLGLSLLYSYIPRLTPKPPVVKTILPVQGANSDSWDFGKIQEGKIFKHDFILKNESQSILEITGVRTSCGCAVSKIQKSRLAPGESTILKVEFNSKGYSGPTQQYIYVNTESLDKPVIRFIIKAEVIK